MAVGVGRTHLFLGQTDTAASPASAGAELYVLSGGYGIPTGSDTALVVETPDIAPLGELGRLRARLLMCPVQYAGACTVQITPIVDYMTELDPLIVALGAPATVTRQVLQVKMLRACTTFRVRMDVLERTGPIEFYTPVLHFAPLKLNSGVAMGESP